MSFETSKELREKEECNYHVIAALLNGLAKMDDTNEECFDNISYLSNLITLKSDNFCKMKRKVSEKSYFNELNIKCYLFLTREKLT